MERAILKAETTVNVSLDEARDWFLSLEEHPERYAFETHAGFAFVRGNFGEVGARFNTREKFHGLRVTLHFELTGVNETRFRFRLLRPAPPVWGAFLIQAQTSHTINLCLEVGGINRLGETILQLPLVHSAVRRQIQGEADHLKASMETVYAEGTESD